MFRFNKNKNHTKPSRASKKVLDVAWVYAGKFFRDHAGKTL